MKMMCAGKIEVAKATMRYDDGDSVVEITVFPKDAVSTVYPNRELSDAGR